MPSSSCVRHLPCAYLLLHPERWQCLLHHRRDIGLLVHGPCVCRVSPRLFLSMLLGRSVVRKGDGHGLGIRFLVLKVVLHCVSPFLRQRGQVGGLSTLHTVRYGRARQAVSL